MLIDVQLPGADQITQMDEKFLLKLEGGFEDATQIVKWVQYHLITDGTLVHRSVDITLKAGHPAIALEGIFQGE